MSILDDYLTPEPDWRERALCGRLDAEPDDWFPKIYGSSTTAERVRDPLEACGWCPVREDCLRTALQLEAGMAAADRHGIWGGLTPQQRAELDPERRGVGNQLDRDTCPWPGTTRGVQRHDELAQPACAACKAFARESETRRERDELVSRLADDGASAWQISLMTGEPYSTVRSILARLERLEPKPIRLATPAENGVPA